MTSKAGFLIAPVVAMVIIMGGGSDAHALLDNVYDRTVNAESTLRFLADENMVPGGPTYSLAGSVPSGANIESQTGMFSWVPTQTQEGSHTITVHVFANGTNTEKSMTVTVNEPIVDRTNARITSGTTLSLSVNPNYHRVEWRLTDTAGAVIDLDNVQSVGQGSWGHPSFDLPDGVTRILTLREDRNGWGDDRNMYLQFTGPNTTPRILPNPYPVLTVDREHTVDEGTRIVINASATDDLLPINRLSFSEQNSPAGSTLNKTGPSNAVFTWTPTEAQGGSTDGGTRTYNFNIRVTDSVRDHSRDVRITVNEVNQDPVPTFAFERRDAILGQTHEFMATFEDADLPPQTLRYDFASAENYGATINNVTGRFVWTPNVTTVSDIVIRVNQSLGDELIASHTVPVSFVVHTTEPDNMPPQINQIPSQSTDELVPLNFTVVATDDGLPFFSEIEYLLSAAAPPGASIDGATGNFTWTPTEAQGGATHTFNITASDGDLTATREISIPVRDTNRDAVPAFDLERDAILDDAHRFTAVISDADLPLQFITYELTGETYGARIDPNTGFFEWTPTAGHEGSRNITIRVNQAEADPTREPKVAASYHTDIVVSFDVMFAPLTEIGNKQVNVYSTLRFPLSAPGGNATATYGLVSPPDRVEIDPETGLFTWNPLGHQIGRHTITATVSHEGAETDRKQFVVEVLNDPLANVTQILASQDRVRAEVHIGDRPIDLRVIDSNGATLGFETGAGEKINTADTISIPNSETTAGREYILEVWPDTRLNPGAGKNRDENVYVWFPGRQDGHVGVTPEFEYISNPADYVFRIPPVVTVGPTPVVAEGSTIMFIVSAIDEDPGAILRFEARGAPANSTLEGTDLRYAVFTWTPGEEDGPQTHNFEIRVHDGTTTATEPVSIQVSESNQDPTPSFDVTDRTAIANEPHTFTAAFEDADLPRQRFEYALSGSTLGAAINRTTGAFEWTPSERHLGGQSITILVFQYVDTEIFGRTETRLVGQSHIPVTFDVQSAPPPNDPPVIAGLSPMVINENDTLTFNVTATDDGRPFGSQIMYTLDGTVPEGAEINGTTGNFTWTPTEAQGGTVLDGARRVYKFNVTASDSQDYDVELIAITVNEVNQDPVPVFDTSREAVVNQTHAFVATVTDTDLPVQYLEYSIHGDSHGATINRTTGVFEWTPEGDDAGNRTITVRIRQDGQYNHDIPVAFVVHPTPPEIPLVIVNADDRTVRQYSTVRFQVDATGAEGNLRFGLKDGPPSDATMNRTTGLFHWFAVTDSDQTFTITATDGTKTAEESITIRVIDPLADITRAQLFLSGDLGIDIRSNDIRIDRRLTDANASEIAGTRRDNTPTNTDVALNYDVDDEVPAGEPRILEIRPAGGSWRNDQNMYVRFDGISSFYVEIGNSAAFALANKPPLLTVQPYLPVVEGSNITITVNATDADFVPDEITFAAPGRPAGSTFNTTADSATFTWTPGEEHGPGTHRFQIEATNGGKTSRETVSVVVLEQNQDPTVTFDTNRRSPPPETGELYTFQATFDDADLPPQRFEYEFVGNSLGADIGRHTGVFEWTPTTGHLGNRDMTIRATQFLGTAEQGQYDVPVQFQVIEPQPDNVAPMLNAIPNQTGAEGQMVTFRATASDDGQPVNIPLTYSLSDDAPRNAVIGRTGGVFSWIPGEEHGGQTHTFNVTVSDSELTHTRQVWVRVNETNQNPVPTFETNRTAISKQSNVFTATIDDPDDPPQNIRYTFDGSSLGAQINPATGVFRWTPSGSQVGQQTIFIKVIQNGVHEHVIRVNFEVPTATLDPLNRTVQAYSTLRFVPFTVGGTDSPMYGLVNEPDGAVIDPATGLFTWVPDGSQIRDHTFNVTVTDLGQTDSKQVVATVINYVANVTEVRASAGSTIPIFNIGGDPLDLRITELDGRRLGLPTGSGQNINQLWSLTIPNTETAAGRDYLLEVKKKGTDWGTDDGVFVQFPGKQNGFVGVDDGFEVISNPNPYRVINRPPVLTVEPTYYEIGEGQTVIVGATATDDREPDNTLTFTAPDRPAGSTFETGTSDAVITWHTNETHGPGTYDFDITVSDGRLSDSERITIRVNEANRDPAPAFSTDRTIAANIRHNFTAAFEDADIPEQTLRYSITGPDRGAIIDEETGHFSWRPNDGHVTPEAQIITIMVDQYIGMVDGTPEYSFQAPVRFTVVPEPPENMAPTLAAIQQQSIEEGGTVVFNAIGNDDGLPIGSTTFSLAGMVPEGATIHPNLGTFVWTPAEDQHGTHRFDVIISDTALNASRPVTINVVETNSNPVFAARPGQTATINTPFTLNLDTTDPDIPAQKVTHQITSQNPQANPAVIDSDTGVITWRPATVEMRTITVRASDDYAPNGTSDITLVVNVLPPNEPPMAADENVTVTEDMPVTFRPVISDTDNTEAISDVQDGAKGDTSHTATTITYAPHQDRNGQDTFEYTVTDSRGASDTARINVMIEPVNDPPVLGPVGDRAVTVGSTLVIVLSADDVDNTAAELTYSLGRGTLPDEATFDNVTGTLRWTPGLDDASDEHEITITVSDPEGLEDSETVTIGAVDMSQNNAISDIIYSASMGSDAVHDLNVTDNDNFIAGSRISDVTDPVITLSDGTVYDDGRAGSVAIADRLIRYTEPPLYGAGGSTVTFDYTISNGASSDTATVTLIPDIPALDAVDDSARTDQGSSVRINVLANDIAVEAELRISRDPDHGNATIGADGTVTYDPDPEYSGIDSFQYAIVRDGQRQTATVSVTVIRTGPIIEPPTPEPPPENLDPEAPDILINAELFFPSAVTPAVTDPDGDDITITSVTEPALGILDTSMLPQISYTPNQTGIERLNYTATDSKMGTDTGTITIFINPDDNARPVLEHIYNIGGRVGVDLDFTAIAADGEGDPLTFDLANAPDGASITAGGDFSWRPAESQNGTHTVAFIVYDDRGGADWQHVTVTVLRADETNLPPVPQDIDAGVVLGGGRGFQPDIADPEGDMTEITRVYDSSLGDVDRSFTSQGIIVYIAGVLGNDEVVYTVSDGRGGFANGTISITVEEPANVRPLIDFVGDKSVNAGDELTFTVDADDLDGFVIDFGLEGDTQGPSMSPLGVFSWTPTANDEGQHEFTILVFDDAGDNSTVTITVTVRPEGYRNSPPVAPDVVIMTPQDVLSIVRPTLTDPDEGDPVRISGTGQTTKGSILSGFLRAGIIIYLPNQGESGTETIPYTVSDSSDDTDTATINVFISARGNTDPILGSIDFRNINAGDPLAFDLEAEDPDGDAISYQTVGAPDDIEISPEGAFSWTPAAADVGNHTFTIVAYDDQGGADSKTAVIRVLPAGTANQVPNAPDSTVTVAPGGSVVITPAISDPDGDRVAIRDAVASGTGVVIPSEDSINYIHIATAPTETITYTVADARGATATGTITITIR